MQLNVSDANAIKSELRLMLPPNSASSGVDCGLAQPTNAHNNLIVWPAQLNVLRLQIDR